MCLLSRLVLKLCGVRVGGGGGRAWNFIPVGTFSNKASAGPVHICVFLWTYKVGEIQVSKILKERVLRERDTSLFLFM